MTDTTVKRPRLTPDALAAVAKLRAKTVKPDVAADVFGRATGTRQTLADKHPQYAEAVKTAYQSESKVTRFDVKTEEDAATVVKVMRSAIPATEKELGVKLSIRDRLVEENESLVLYVMVTERRVRQKPKDSE